MSKFFKDCFTGKDNATYDLGRILWAICVLSFLALCFYKTFGAIETSTGIVTVLASGAASLWIKRETEPLPKDKNDTI